jgi:DNA-binding CsgD family transcriptional regulator/PAS domain-containing protein
MEVALERELLPIVDRIYESVERPELWPETIHMMGEIIGGRLGFWGMGAPVLPPGVNPELNRHWLRAGSHAYFLSRADLKFLDQYVDEFGELIVRFLKIICLSVLYSQNDIDNREIIGVRLARRYLPAFEPVAGTSISAPSRPALRRLIAGLWEDGCVFSNDDLIRIRALIPHLDRALRLQMRLNAAELQTEMVSGALDCLTLGVIFVNRSGVPLWLNRRAQELINSSGVLRVSSTGLIGRDPSDTRSMNKLIQQAISEEKQTALAVARELDARPLLLIAVSLRPVASSEGSDALPCGVVFISDPDRIDAPSVDSLRQAFNLTRREAQTAIAIAHGHGLQAAAQSMGIAVTTARSQLQQAFSKTGTSHQAELAALVHRTLAPFRSP